MQPVDLVDLNRFDSPQTTWTLYEKMPPDRRGLFKQELRARVDKKSKSGEQSTPADQNLNAFVERMNDETQEFDIATFTEILKRDFLQAGRLGYDPDSLDYEQMIDQYAFDGQPIKQIEEYARTTPGRKNTKFEPTPQEIFVRYTFTADSTSAVKTDGIGALETEGLFNRAGEAVVGKLMQNPEGVTFKENDTIVIDKPSSAEFERSHAGKVKNLGEIYRRQLQDFPLMFKNRRLRVANLEEEIIKAQETVTKTEIALKDAREQINIRTELLEKGTEDEERFTRDSDTLRQANASFTQQSEQLAMEIKTRKQKIDSLYQQIKAQALAELRGAVTVSN